MFSLCFKVVIGSLLVVVVITEDSPTDQISIGRNKGDDNNIDGRIINEQANDEDNIPLVGERQTRGVGAVTNNIKIGHFEKINCEGLIPQGRKVREAADYSKALGFFTQLKCTALENFLSNRKLIDCQAIKSMYKRSKSGVYTIYPGGTAVRVYCDMITDGGGWTVIQRRIDGKENFQRKWDEYKEGFGNLSADHWIGNENIYTLTKNKKYELRIDMKDWKRHERYAKYKSFSISSETGKYRLSLGSWSGHNVYHDSMAIHNKQCFSTKDRDNDIHKESCSLFGRGGWWYSDCYYSNLNGIYKYSSKTDPDGGIRWFNFVKPYKGGDIYESLKMSEMKIRPT